MKYLVLLLVLFVAINAQALDVTLDGATDFTAVGGVVDVGAGSGETLNTTAATNGFGSFFSTDYLSLGATGDQTISSSSIGVTSSAKSSLFTYDDDSSNLFIEYDYIFTGSNMNGSNSFQIILFDSSDNFVALFENLNVYGSATTRRATVSSALLTLDQDYYIQISLSENFIGNSAAGFDNVRVSNVPEPTTILGSLMVAAAGLVAVRRRRK